MCGEGTTHAVVHPGPSPPPMSRPSCTSLSFLGLCFCFQFKGGDSDFVPTKLMTRLTYTLDEVS